jgi:electron transfer flavoprotein alpha subunit
LDKLLALLATEPDGSLGRPALETLAACRELASSLGAPFEVALFGAAAQPAAAAAAASGAARILTAVSPELGQARYASDAAAAEALARASAASLVLAPHTSRLARVLAGVAFRLQGRADTHVTEIAAVDGAVSVTRWYYRQRIEATLTRAERPWLVALEPGLRAPWSGGAGTATVEAVRVDDPASRTSVKGFEAPPADEQTIRPEAELLFVAGAGWTKPQAGGATRTDEAERLILGFLEESRASLGGSKSLVDVSGEGQAVLRFMTHLNQVGQTGSTPRHPKGLATCCHGEEPHTVGWRFIGERRAVNRDPSCGWTRGKADVVYVADAFEVMAKLNAILAERRQARASAEEEELRPA